MNSQLKIPIQFWQKFQVLLPKNEFKKFKAISLTPIRKSIRINTLKISVSEFKKYAKKLELKLEEIPWCKNGFWIEREDRSIPLGKSYLHQSGFFYIQEASSMLPVAILNPKKNDIVLDLAAAPGSKTTQIAEYLNNTGIIVANEPKTNRIKALSSNIERIGAANIMITQKEGQVFSEYFPNFFDKILLDAPCSSEGTIRKDHNALISWNEKRVNSIANLQEHLLIHAFQALKPGGEMVYSTCTLSTEENENNVQKLLDKFKNNAELIPLIYPNKKKEVQCNLKGTLKIWLHMYDSEGFFVAKIKKNFPTEEGIFQQTRRNSPFRKMSKGSLSWLNKILAKYFGITIYNIDNFFERGNEIWIRPKKFEIIASKIIVEKGGILICEKLKNNDIKFTHNGAMFLAQNYPIKSGYIDLTEKECNDYLAGFDIQKTYNKKQIVFIKYNGIIVGIGKSLGEKIKNMLPKYFVI